MCKHPNYNKTRLEYNYVEDTSKIRGCYVSGASKLTQIHEESFPPSSSIIHLWINYILLHGNDYNNNNS